MTEKCVRLSDIQRGNQLPSHIWNVTQKDIERFGDLLYPPSKSNPSRSGNPHIDKEYAAKHIYGGITVDGNHTVAVICEMLACWLPDGAMTSGDTEVNITFPNPCRPDDIIAIQASVLDTAQQPKGYLATFSVEGRNQNGKIIAVGSVTTRFPPDLSA